MPTTLLAKGLTAPASATPKRSVKLAPEGIVTAIVAVTGVVDAVQDLIVPGAFSATLKVRRPKVVDDHQWQNKVGRVLHVEEWLPGDPRLPKRTKDGQLWPAAAGALVATMQYNLRADRGREAYEWVRFYAESNEAEFSIGYKVPDGQARKRADGVRVILMVDLFEFSHVLFGAAPLSMALDVKSIAGAAGAGTVTKPALGDAEETDGEFDTPPAIDTRKPWEDENGKAPWEKKTAASVVLEAKDGNAGNADTLRRWFEEGADGAIPWGSDGDFDACVAIASKHMSPEDAKGYCNLRHHAVLGIYPATHAAMEGKQATPQEVKAMSNMKGSYEERISKLDTASRDLLATTLNKEPDEVGSWPVATYATEVVVRVCGPDGEEAYLIPYTADEDGNVALDKPQKVELSLVAAPEDGDGDYDGDNAETEAAEGDGETPSVEEAVAEAVLAPVIRLTRTQGKAAQIVREALTVILERKSANPDDELSPADRADSSYEENGEPNVYPPGADDENAEPMPDDENAEGDPASGAPAGFAVDDGTAHADPNAQPDGGADNEGTEPTPDDETIEKKVTLSPDEHFALMDSLTVGDE